MSKRSRPKANSANTTGEAGTPSTESGVGPRESELLTPEGEPLPGVTAQELQDAALADWLQKQQKRRKP